tara:strand:- start:645 stop:866 length:222 start_codon:yes stop_codon:yes gene_type:complete
LTKKLLKKTKRLFQYVGLAEVRFKEPFLDVLHVGLDIMVKVMNPVVSQILKSALVALAQPLILLMVKPFQHIF